MQITAIERGKLAKATHEILQYSPAEYHERPIAHR